MGKLRGKARQRARAKARLKSSLPKQDVVLAEAIAKMMMKQSSGSIGFAHLEPVKIITDTAWLYEAQFEDAMGQYDFIIEHKADGYHVISSGVPRGPFASIDAVLWEFEVQLSTHGPKVLQGRTYQGRGSFNWNMNGQGLKTELA